MKVIGILASLAAMFEGNAIVMASNTQEPSLQHDAISRRDTLSMQKRLPKSIDLENLVANPSFEFGKPGTPFIAGWIIHPSFGDSTACDQIDGIGSEGSHSIRCFGFEHGATDVVQKLYDIDLGKYHTLSFRATITPPPTGDDDPSLSPALSVSLGSVFAVQNASLCTDGQTVGCLRSDNDPITWQNYEIKNIKPFHWALRFSWRFKHGGHEFRGWLDDVRVIEQAGYTYDD